MCHLPFMCHLQFIYRHLLLVRRRHLMIVSTTRPLAQGARHVQKSSAKFMMLQPDIRESHSLTSIPFLLTHSDCTHYRVGGDVRLWIMDSMNPQWALWLMDPMNNELYILLIIITVHYVPIRLCFTIRSRDHTYTLVNPWVSLLFYVLYVTFIT